jgi:hypothetical protein
MQKSLYFHLQPFKIDRCCKFLGLYKPRIYVNMSTPDVVVFREQVVKGRVLRIASNLLRI